MEYNSLVLAYIGDAIYEVLVRKHLIDKGFIKVNDLQKEVFLTMYRPHGKRRYVNKESGQRTGKSASGGKMPPEQHRREKS